MKQVKQIFVWIVLQGLYTWSAWLAVTSNNSGPANLFKFACWLLTVLAILLAVYASSPDRPSKRARSMPWQVSLSCDMGIAMMLAWHGWFLYASLVFIQAFCELIVYGTGKKQASDVR